MLNALSAATLPTYPGLGQAWNNAGLYTGGLVYPVAWFSWWLGIFIIDIQCNSTQQETIVPVSLQTVPIFTFCSSGYATM